MDTEEELIKFKILKKGTYVSIEDFEPRDLSQCFLKNKITPILGYISSELRRNGNIDKENCDFTIIDGGLYNIKVGIIFVHPFSRAPTHKLNILIFQERGDGISPSDIDRYFYKRFDSPNYFLDPLNHLSFIFALNISSYLLNQRYKIFSSSPGENIFIYIL